MQTPWRVDKTSHLFGGKGAGVSVTKTRFADRARRIELLGRHARIAAFDQRPEVVNNFVAIDQRTMTDKEAYEIYSRNKRLSILQLDSE